MDDTRLDDAPLSALIEISSIFESMGIPYLLGGSLASSIRGTYRATNDVDILAALTPGKLNRFFTRLSSRFIYDDVAIERAVVEERPFNIIHDDTFLKIDIFTKIGCYEEEQLRRAEAVAIPGYDGAVRVASAEDIILAKIQWFKKGGEVSERQWQDVLGVIRVQRAGLNLEYLLKWAKTLGIVEILERALRA